MRAGIRKAQACRCGCRPPFKPCLPGRPSAAAEMPLRGHEAAHRTRRHPSGRLQLGMVSGSTDLLHRRRARSPCDELRENGSCQNGRHCVRFCRPSLILPESDCPGTLQRNPYPPAGLASPGGHWSPLGVVVVFDLHDESRYKAREGGEKVVEDLLRSGPEPPTPSADLAPATLVLEVEFCDGLRAHSD